MSVVIVLLTCLATNLIIFGAAAANLGDNPDGENDIAFDLPDLAATMEASTGGEYQMEAFKSVNNDRILQNAAAGGGASFASSQLFWVSVGQPSVVKTAVPSKTGQTNSTPMRLFLFSTSGFYTYVQMLTPAQRRLLAATANTKYHGAGVAENQIVNLILSKFECSLPLYDLAGNKYLVKSKVTDFRRFPLRLDFTALQRSIERKLFDALANGVDDLNEVDFSFTCQMASSGKLIRTNTLMIGLRQQEQIGLVDKLFGTSTSTPSTEAPSKSVYVTRDQITTLAEEMYSTLNIVDDYQMPVIQFDEAFVDGLIREAAAEVFTMVRLDKALDTLSKYGFDFDDDLKADHMKRDLGSVLKIEQYANASRIIVDETRYHELQQKNSGSGNGNAGVKVLDLFGLDASANWAHDNSMSSKDDTKSLNDQLHQLNEASQNRIEWMVEGDVVVPKRLNVARLQRSSFGHGMTFQRVRIQSFSAPFEREFSIYTRDSVLNPATPLAVDQIRA